MKLLYIIFFTFFILSQSFGQNATLSGNVKDAVLNEGIIGASVTYQEGKGTVTDFDGNYSIEIPPGTYTITFSYIGYNKLTRDVTLKEGDKKELNVVLEEESTTLDVVVVSAGRFEQKLGDVPVSMEVLQPKLIENKNTTNVETILEQVPGVNINDGQISIRGGSGFAYGAGSRVLMMMDGMPLITGDAGDVKWNTLPIETIEQIEVMKGASSVLYGSSALNGVINIRTAFAKDKPETKVSFTHGIYGNPVREENKWWDKNPTYSGLSFSHSQMMKKNFDLVIGGSGFTDNGYRQGEEEHRYRFNFSTRYRSKKVEGLSFGLNGNFQQAKGLLYLIWRGDSAVLQPQGPPDPTVEGSTVSLMDNDRLNLDPYITYFTKKGNRHSLKTRWYRTNNRNINEHQSLATLYYGEYQFQKQWKEKKMTMTTGLVGMYSDVESAFYGDHNSNNIAAFAQFDKKAWDKVNFSFGFRGEYYRVDTVYTDSTSLIFPGVTDNEMNFVKKTRIGLPIQPVLRAGVTYQALEETYLRLSYGQGYRFPSIAEKFASTSVGALNIFPNNGIQPEFGASAEFGIKQGVKIGKWKGYADVAAFITEYEDMVEYTFGLYVPEDTILTVNNLANFIGFQSQNVENARISGIDFSLVGSGKIRGVDISVFAGYTYLNPIAKKIDSLYRSSFSDSASNMLKYRYRHLAKADVQFDYKKFGIGFSCRYNSAMENIDKVFVEAELNGTPLSVFGVESIVPGLKEYREKYDGSATVFDARISYQITNYARLAIVVNNVTNQEYYTRPGDVQPPRTYAMQFSMKF